MVEYYFSVPFVVKEEIAFEARPSFMKHGSSAFWGAGEFEKAQEVGDSP